MYNVPVNCLTRDVALLIGSAVGLVEDVSPIPFVGLGRSYVFVFVLIFSDL